MIPEILYIILLIIFSSTSTLSILLVLRQEKRNRKMDSTIETLEKRNEILVRITAKHEHFLDLFKQKSEEMDIRRRGKVR
jgi:hypothetical protein